MHLEVENLTCGYHGKAVVRNVSIRAKDGELWCVLGANGIGKTTLFKTMLGLLKPIGGSVCFDGRNIQEIPHKERAKTIAYVPQSHAPAFSFSVEDVIAMGRNPYRASFIGNRKPDDAAAIDNALGLVGIEHLRASLYTKVSGGERQLVLLARAIAQETPALVLDEPVSNLDFGNQARIIAHILRLVKTLNKTVVMTTHFPDHGFLPDCNVLLLYPDGTHRVGKGRDIVTERAIHNLYHIENRVIDLDEYQKKLCISLE
jgi:iron complex transport system ATP-binding protein